MGNELFSGDNLQVMRDHIHRQSADSELTVAAYILCVDITRAMCTVCA